MNGKVYCLRGGREHKALKISQFTSGSDDEGNYIIYTENGSKNRSGTYRDKPGSNKVIKHYANSTLGHRCFVSLVKLYLEKLPPSKKMIQCSIGNPKILSRFPMMLHGLLFK